MTSLLLSILTLAALGVESPAPQEPVTKPAEDVVKSVPVKSFKISRDGKFELEMLDDQGIA